MTHATAKPRTEIDSGVNDAVAQLVEMLHQAHAGEVCALGNGVRALSMASAGSTMVVYRLGCGSGRF